MSVVVVLLFFLWFIQQTSCSDTFNVLVNKPIDESQKLHLENLGEKKLLIDGKLVHIEVYGEKMKSLKQRLEECENFRKHQNIFKSDASVTSSTNMNDDLNVLFASDQSHQNEPDLLSRLNKANLKINQLEYLLKHEDNTGFYTYIDHKLEIVNTQNSELKTNLKKEQDKNYKLQQQIKQMNQYMSHSPKRKPPSSTQPIHHHSEHHVQNLFHSSDNQPEDYPLDVTHITVNQHSNHYYTLHLQQQVEEFTKKLIVQKNAEFRSELELKSCRVSQKKCEYTLTTLHQTILDMKLQATTHHQVNVQNDIKRSIHHHCNCNQQANQHIELINKLKNNELHLKVELSECKLMKSTNALGSSTNDDCAKDLQKAMKLCTTNCHTQISVFQNNVNRLQILNTQLLQNGNICRNEIDRLNLIIQQSQSKPDTPHKDLTTKKPPDYPAKRPTNNPTNYPTKISNPTYDSTMDTTQHQTQDPIPQQTQDPSHPTQDATQHPTTDQTPDSTQHPTQGQTQITSMDPTQHPTQDQTPDHTQDPKTMNPTQDPTPDSKQQHLADSAQHPIDQTQHPIPDQTPDPTQDQAQQTTLDPTQIASIPDHTPDPTQHPEAMDPTQDPTHKHVYHATDQKPSSAPLQSYSTQHPTTDQTPDPTQHQTQDQIQITSMDPTQHPTQEQTPYQTQDPAPGQTPDSTQHPTDETQHPIPDETPDPTRHPTQDQSQHITPDPTQITSVDPTQHTKAMDPTPDHTYDPPNDPTQDPTHKHVYHTTDQKPSSAPLQLLFQDSVIQTDKIPDVCIQYILQLQQSQKCIPNKISILFKLKKSGMEMWNN